MSFGDSTTSTGGCVSKYQSTTVISNAPEIAARVKISTGGIMRSAAAGSAVGEVGVDVGAIGTITVEVTIVGRRVGTAVIVGVLVGIGVDVGALVGVEACDRDALPKEDGDDEDPRSSRSSLSSFS